MDTLVIQIVVIFTNVILGLFVLSQDPKSTNNRLFSIMSLIAAIWTLANYLDSISNSIIWMEASYSLGVLVITSGYFWTLSMTKQKIGSFFALIILAIAIVISLSSYLPGFIFQSITRDSSGVIPIGVPGVGLFAYTIFYFINAYNIIKELYKAKLSAVTNEHRKQFRNILFGAFVTLFVTFVSSFILPFFSIFPFGGIDNTGFLIFLLFIAYAITKHHLFSIKIIAMELTTFALWVFILMRTAMATSLKEAFIEGGLLVITVVFGVTLIRSALHEMRQMKKIEEMAGEIRSAYAKVSDLNDNLRLKVAEQTADVRRALEVEKQAKVALEKLNATKDQFITSTQHEFRTPMTAIKWELESIGNGTYGNVTKKLNASLENIDTSVKRLDNIIENFIVITEKK